METDKKAATPQDYEPVPRYRTYLLRCWEMRGQHPDHPTTWRFSLHDSQTGQKRSFADLQALTAFLKAKLGLQDARAQEESESP